MRALRRRTTALTAAAAAGACVLAGAAVAAIPHMGSTPTVTNLNRIQTATGGGLTLMTVRGGVSGHKLAFSGSGPAGQAGATIEIQAATHPDRSSSWKTVERVTLRTDGTFAGVWRPAHVGRISLRAELEPGSSGTTTTGGGGLPSDPDAPASDTGVLGVQIFKAAEATLYGPGFWGDRTACGQKLQRSEIGVANRTLKCGTKVAIDYRGRELIAPVIDRGPYGTKAKWDLTMATAKALKIQSTATIATLTANGK